MTVRVEYILTHEFEDIDERDAFESLIISEGASIDKTSEEGEYEEDYDEEEDFDEDDLEIFIHQGQEPSDL
jgi:hypothetical protein